MKVRTLTGSIYEIDISTKKIRRLSGKGNPTQRTGEDGVWREFNHISSIEKGKSISIIWGFTTGATELTENADALTIAKGTETSPVEEIILDS